MSAIAMQRVVVRMMYDPTFRQRVYADPQRALSDVPLTAQERQWLIAPSPAAYGADPHRSSRALTGLLEEFPVAGALAVRMPRGLPWLRQFFSSQAFHQCVQQRGSMAAAFGTYLSSAAKGMRSRQKPGDIVHMAALETGIAQVRRSSPPRPPGIEPTMSDTVLHLAPWVTLLTVHPDTLQHYGTWLEALRQHPKSLVEAVLDTRFRLPSRPALRGKALDFVLVSYIPGSDGPSLECVTSDLGQLLTAVQTPLPLHELCTLAEDMGCDPEEAREVIAGLVDDRVLSCG